LSRRLVQVFGIVLLVVAAGTVAFLYLRRRSLVREEIEARKRTVSLGPKVLVTKVEPGAGVRRLTLPGEARPFLSTTVYAKLPGYVREMRTDKGMRVEQGDVLAVLASPETEQQVRAAETNVALQRQLAARADALARVGVMSQQDKEIADAQLRTAIEGLRQLRDIQSYQVIRAPFSGLVTARYADPGALIPAATGSTQAAQPLVDLLDTGTLRITLFVGQDAAPSIRMGDKAVLWTDDQPDRRLEAPISRISGQLAPATRTMLIEVWLDNRDVGIVPGTFVNVELEITEPQFPTIPNAAIIVRAGRILAAVVEDNRIHLVPIEVGASDGTRTQVTKGLTPGQLVANDLPAELNDGAVIQPVFQQRDGG
jgi:membrane fusion protein, multidrug efflux system